MKSQGTTERLRALCLAPEQTSSLTIDSHGQRLLLRRSYHPWFAGLFSYGLAGGLCYAISKSGAPPGILLAGSIFLAALATWFVFSAVKGKRQPPLLDLENDTGVLHLPHTGESFPMSAGLHLGIQRLDFIVTGGNERSIYGALYLMPGDGPEPLPVFVEPSLGHLRQQASKFAALAGLEIKELPAMALKDKED